MIVQAVIGVVSLVCELLLSSDDHASGFFAAAVGCAGWVAEAGM